jgi:hypothetical protein
VFTVDPPRVLRIEVFVEIIVVFCNMISVSGVIDDVIIDVTFITEFDATLSIEIGLEVTDVASSDIFLGFVVWNSVVT